MFELIQSISIDAKAGQAIGKVVVPANHPMLADHFPGLPILPGSFLVELAAQVAGPLAEEVIKLRHGLDRWAIIGMIRDAKFLRPSPVPSNLMISAEVLRSEASNTLLHVSITESNQPVMRGELLMMMMETTPAWEEAIKARNARLARWKAAS
jgi:3-hydroxymyristoyl/3-hydroxydecanoyl-(acyl carrier protein) dehydratase